MSEKLVKIKDLEIQQVNLLKNIYLKDSQKIWDVSKTLYKTKQTKVELVCKVCKNSYFVTPQTIEHLKEIKCKACKEKAKLAKFKKFIQAIDTEKWDVSKASYKGIVKKFELICKKCNNSYFLTPQTLYGLKTIKCKECEATKRCETFKKLASKAHNNYYNYDHLTKIYNIKDKFLINCPKHGMIKTSYEQHATRKLKCFKCSRTTPNTLELLKEKIIEKFGDIYDFSETTYQGPEQKFIQVKCKTCQNTFNLRYSTSITAQKNTTYCPYCISGRTKHFNTDVFIYKAKQIHNNFIYDYSLTEYKTNKEKIKIICPKHGVFEQTPHSHLAGAGCPKCRLSKGETLVASFLKTNNIEFEQQKTFPDLRYKKPLRLDFYLPDFKIVIEVQGGQHYSLKDLKHLTKIQDETKLKEKLEIIKLRDSIKRNYCKKNNLKMIEISDTRNLKKHLSFLID